MTAKQLIEELQKVNPESEVHIVNDRGYYPTIESLHGGDFICGDKHESTPRTIVIISVA